MAFALRARGGVDRFQCLLRSGPAAATVAHRAESAGDCPKSSPPKPGTLMTHWLGSRAGMKTFHQSCLTKSEIVP